VWVECRVALAHAYAAARRLDDCRRLVDQLRRAFPDSAEAVAAAGLLELEARHASRALALLRRAESAGLRSPDIYADIGQAYLRLRLFADGARAFERAISADEELSRAWVGLSAAKLGGGDPDGAVASARRAVALAPASADAHYRLGRALAAAGQDVAARRALESAVDFAPEFPAALRKLSELAARAGDLKSAGDYDRRAHLAAFRRRWRESMPPPTATGMARSTRA
jgi:tetratricopeptide (TPR) repeat protein